MDGWTGDFDGSSRECISRVRVGCGGCQGSRGQGGGGKVKIWVRIVTLLPYYPVIELPSPLLVLALLCISLSQLLLWISHLQLQALVTTCYLSTVVSRDIRIVSILELTVPKCPSSTLSLRPPLKSSPGRKLTFTTSRTLSLLP